MKLGLTITDVELLDEDFSSRFSIIYALEVSADLGSGVRQEISSTVLLRMDLIYSCRSLNRSFDDSWGPSFVSYTSAFSMLLKFSTLEFCNPTESKDGSLGVWWSGKLVPNSPTDKYGSEYAFRAVMLDWSKGFSTTLDLS